MEKLAGRKKAETTEWFLVLRLRLAEGSVGVRWRKTVCGQLHPNTDSVF